MIIIFGYFIFWINIIVINILFRQGRPGIHQVCGLRDLGLAQRVLLLQQLQRVHGWQGIHPGRVLGCQGIHPGRVLGWQGIHLGRVHGCQGFHLGIIHGWQEIHSMVGKELIWFKSWQIQVQSMVCKGISSFNQLLPRIHPGRVHGC